MEATVQHELSLFLNNRIPAESLRCVNFSCAALFFETCSGKMLLVLHVLDTVERIISFISCQLLPHAKERNLRSYEVSLHFGRFYWAMNPYLYMGTHGRSVLHVYLLWLLLYTVHVPVNVECVIVPTGSVKCWELIRFLHEVSCKSCMRQSKTKFTLSKLVFMVSSFLAQQTCAPTEFLRDNHQHLFKSYTCSYYYAWST